MTPAHINPGTDTTINPVVIDDSYRERKRKEQPRVDWVEEVRLRCYSYTVFYGGERVIRFDELGGVIQQVKEERKECYDAHTGAPLHPPTAQKPRQPCEECIYQAKAVEARQRVELENLCNIDLTHYVWGEMAAEDVSQCRGKDCNYCGRWTALLQAGRK